MISANRVSVATELLTIRSTVSKRLTPHAEVKYVNNQIADYLIVVFSAKYLESLYYNNYKRNFLRIVELHPLSFFHSFYNFYN